MAIERPRYSVEFSDPPYEIRSYSPTIVAVVDVEGQRSEAVNAGFRILAGYIFGDNQGHGKIAMTAPVTQTPGRFTAMTAPVTQQSSAAGWEIRFTMPSAYTMNALPTPKDARVHLIEIAKHRVASIKFSGFWSDANLKSHTAQLREWLKTRNAIAISEPTYAYYDPPWTPWFLRTIEVLIDIESTQSTNSPSSSPSQ